MLRLNGVSTMLRRRLPAFSVAICVLQPLLDVLSYWQIQLDLPNYFTLGLRVLTIGLMLLTALPFLHRKRLFLSVVLVLLLFLAGHVITCLKLSPTYHWKEDLSEQARILFLPVSAFCLICYLRANDKVFPALKLGLVISFGLILLVMVLSTVTGTDPHTYAAKGIGVRGWFFWTSAQGAILSLLCPVVIAWTEERFPGKRLPPLAACLLSFGALFAFGTRLAYASLAAVGVCLAVCTVLSNKKLWPQALTVFLSAALFLALFPVSPMKRNQSAILENARIKQDRVNAAAVEAGKQLGLEDPLSPEHRTDLRVLAPAYRYNLQGMMDRFGVERVALAYDYTLDVVRVCDDRVRKLIFCKLLMEDSMQTTPLACLFGLELGRTRVEETDGYVFETDQWERQPEASDPENDFFGVYYLCGFVGLGLLLLFLGFFAQNSLWSLWREPQKTLAPGTVSFLIAFAIALVYAWSTVSVLRRNNASFYFAAILACVWHQTRVNRSAIR